jgi:hypothetical protein
MSPQVIELKTLARRYCNLVDCLDEGNSEWLQQVASLLPKLHAAITSLNLPEPKDGYHFSTDLDARFELFSQLRSLLGERDSYWMQFDVSGDEQSMSGSLADDLTDIYCELKSGLRRFDGEPERAIEDWHKGYHLHWGQHLIDAERHLYDLRTRNQLTM